MCQSSRTFATRSCLNLLERGACSNSLVVEVSRCCFGVFPYMGLLYDLNLLISFVYGLVCQQACQKVCLLRSDLHRRAAAYLSIVRPCNLGYCDSYSLVV